MIHLQGASVSLDTHPILHDLHWSMNTGENWVILGGNGAGKSTFLRLLAGTIWPRPHDSRVYNFDSESTWSPLRAREEMRLLSPETQERYWRALQDGVDHEKGWNLAAWEAILTGFFNSELLHQTPTPDQHGRMCAVVRQLHLEDLAERPLGTLSQGQLRRVLLARAVVAKPRVLLLDEACSGLDAASRTEMLDLIQTLAESGQQLVMTTHREAEIVPAINGRLYLEHGRIVAKPSRVFSNQLTDSSTFQPTHDSTHPLIQLDNVSVFLDGHPVLHELDWQLLPGQQWAVAGANGAGKSTFLRLLRGELAPAFGGQIRRFGSAVPRPVWEIGEDIALLSPLLQARYAEQLPVEDAVASGFFQTLGAPGLISEGQRERVRACMELCRVEQLAGRTFGRLSYGQTRRVLLARALVTSPKLLLLDEALDGLDVGARAEFSHLLEELIGQGLHIMVVSHHEEDWPPVLTHVLRLEDGRISSQTNLNNRFEIGVDSGRTK